MGHGAKHVPQSTGGRSLGLSGPWLKLTASLGSLGGVHMAPLTARFMVRHPVTAMGRMSKAFSVTLGCKTA